MPFRWWPHRSRPGTPPPGPPTVPRPVAPQPFRSSHYGYRLLLPPDWRVVPGGVAAPAVDVFERPDVAARLSLWSAASALRVLPSVPPAQRAFTLALPDGSPVPFVVYALPAAGRACLEGRWVQAGQRWHLDLQLPAERTAHAADLLRPLWASLELDG